MDKTDGGRERGVPIGKHLFLDYVNFRPSVENSGDWVISIMRQAVESVGVREVHHHCEQFDGNESPPGFAAVVLIDESHVTAHCYSERGILAVDIFTCGEHDPKDIADAIHSSLAAECPDLIVSQRQEVSRFIE